jgi:DNA repair exonuclease SbcCD ATPase subunit
MDIDYEEGEETLDKKLERKKEEKEEKEQREEELDDFQDSLCPSCGRKLPLDKSSPTGYGACTLYAQGTYVLGKTEN